MSRPVRSKGYPGCAEQFNDTETNFCLFQPSRDLLHPEFVIEYSVGGLSGVPGGLSIRKYQEGRHGVRRW
jgi:hypothetical protein